MTRANDVMIKCVMHRGLRAKRVIQMLSSLRHKCRGRDKSTSLQALLHEGDLLAKKQLCTALEGLRFIADNEVIFRMFPSGR
jgi:hypothetical protein